MEQVRKRQANRREGRYGAVELWLTTSRCQLSGTAVVSAESPRWPSSRVAEWQSDAATAAEHHQWREGNGGDVVDDASGRDNLGHPYLIVTGENSRIC